MAYQALENTPLQISLLDVSTQTGWSVSGNIATHEACNAGNLYVVNYPLVSGQVYKFSWQVITCSSGYVQAFLGTTGGAQHTAPTGVITESVTASGTNPQFYFYANGNCSIQNFTISIVSTSTSLTQQNTLAYSVKTNKWVSFYSYIPDNAFSLFINTYSFFNGDLYVHQSGSLARNNFYGVDYKSIIQFVDNVSPTIPKSFLSLSVQSNELMITGDNGISTSLGQISELSDIDFIKNFLTDGVSSFNQETIEGVYSAAFLRDKNDDLINGTPLKGNYIILTLISTSNQPLQLYTVNVVSGHSAIGAR